VSVSVWSALIDDDVVGEAAAKATAYPGGTFQVSPFAMFTITRALIKSHCGLAAHRHLVPPDRSPVAAKLAGRKLPDYPSMLYVAARHHSYI
jgi:hypothetical protein